MSSASVFGTTELMDLLCKKVGLPAARRTDVVDTYFIDLGLDSLAFLQLQAELDRNYGVQMPDDQAHLYTVADIIDIVQGHLNQKAVA